MAVVVVAVEEEAVEGVGDDVAEVFWTSVQPRPREKGTEARRVRTGLSLGAGTRALSRGGIANIMLVPR